ncbi:MAG: formyltransferase family protein [Bacteroidota bacterium]
MSTYLFLSEKSWHDSLFESLKSAMPDANWLKMNDKVSFTKNYLNEIKPDKIFIPHWSHIIPATIYDSFECVVFHMTDLPYGRGGSPLQNLIVRGHKSTKISAIKVSKGIDTGDVYLKSDLSLNGTATEIFSRSISVIEEMIKEIIKNNPIPKKQEGEVVEFKRRKPEDSNISELQNVLEVYDYIRMLDCEGYPNAFAEIGNFRFEFTKASENEDKSIIANVRITQK